MTNLEPFLKSREHFGEGRKKKKYAPPPPQKRKEKGTWPDFGSSCDLANLSIQCPYTSHTGLREQVPAVEKAAGTGFGPAGRADHHPLRPLRHAELRHVLRAVVPLPQGAAVAVPAVAALYPLLRPHAQLHGEVDSHGPQDHSQWPGVRLQEGKIRRVWNEPRREAVTQKRWAGELFMHGHNLILLVVCRLQRQFSQLGKSSCPLVPAEGWAV